MKHIYLFLLSFIFCANMQAQTTTTLNSTVRDITDLDMGFNRRSDNGTWWTDNSFKTLVTEMNPDVVRYPGGTQANYWDWTTGRFLDNTDKNWGNKEVLKIPEFVDALPSRTKVIYVINMARPTPATGISVTANEATLKSQSTLNKKIEDMIDAVDKFVAEGKTPYAVELGNEFYFGNEEGGIFHISESTGKYYSGWDTANNQAFESANKKDATVINAKFYLDQCKDIVAGIKAVYPNMKFAITTTKRGNGNSTREKWNNTIFDELENNSDYTTLKGDIDAVTQHHYLNDSYGVQTAISDNATAKVAIAEGIEYPIDKQADYNMVPNDYKIWYTEYGEVKKIAEETWASAVRYAALAYSWMSLGDKVGQLDWHFITNKNVVRTDSPMKLAPVGIAAKQVSKAFADMTEMQEVNFSPNPISVNSVKSLYGYRFKNNDKETLLIINTSDSDFTQVQFSNLATYSGQAVMTQYYSSSPYVSDVYDGHSNIVSSTSNVSGNIDINKFSITVVEIPAVPNAATNASATEVSCTAIDITWVDNSNNETGFKIMQSISGGAYTLYHTTAENITSYSATGLNENTEYGFRVQAYNSQGNSASAQANLLTTSTCPTIPSAPTTLAATVSSSTQINLSWTDNSSDETGFKIERKTGSGAYALVTTTAANTTSYNDTGLTESTAYTYRVKGTNATGDSGNSNEVSATTQSGALNYCASNGQSTSDEYIQRVQIGSIDNTTTASSGGYGDYTSLSTNLNSGSNTITITPAWTSATYEEGYAVWIDLNKDGDFGDSGELVFSKTASTSTTATGTFSIPSGSSTGTTRMRVSMKYAGVPSQCESFSYGEVEDYTVVLPGTSSAKGSGKKESLTVVNKEPITAISVYPNPTTGLLTLNIKNADLEHGTITVFDSLGRSIQKEAITSEKMNIQLKGESAVYFLIIRNNGVVETKRIIKK